MEHVTPNHIVLDDEWSDLRKYQDMPEIDFDALYAYRLARIRKCMADQDVAVCVMHNPISLRYAAEYRTYGIFQSHIPETYLFVPQDGPVVINTAYGTPPGADEVRNGRALAYFDGGQNLADHARLLADDIVNFLKEIGSDSRRVAIEYVNPSITQALLQRGLEVTDGVAVSEQARVIKCEEEIKCIRWAIDVADLGISKVKEALRPGVTEVQLWALLNYTNLANCGDWHEGRMLASGPRINPWWQEATDRRIEAGDLVGFDTDMVGPFGYFADISRTFFCGPGTPSSRQKKLYRLAVEEIEHNLGLIKPGITFSEFQKAAWPVPEEFHENAYPCVFHGVGMGDEYPRVNPVFRGPTPYDGVIEAGMVLCMESYMGAVGERDGVKLEQQILVTDDGYELLSHTPLERALLD